ncbi:UNVERIFIED_CONTAM: hypothetical protein FKN15_027473 [Acipenser sinensis]
MSYTPHYEDDSCEASDTAEQAQAMVSKGMSYTPHYKDDSCEASDTAEQAQAMVSKGYWIGLRSPFK